MTLSPPTPGALKPGFADPVFDAQAAFRATLDGMAYPGRVRDIGVTADPPAPLNAASALVALTLFDFDTRVWLDPEAGSDEAREFLKFHCGCPIGGSAAEAQFALIAASDSMPGLEVFGIGEDRYPDRSATLVIQLSSLSGGPVTRWTGPGIDGGIDVSLDGLPDRFWSQWEDNSALYPQGVDIIFTCGSALIGLPRTIKVEA